MRRLSPANSSPSATDPYYTTDALPTRLPQTILSIENTKPVEPIEKWGGPSPVNWPQVYRVLLHQNQYNLLRNEEALLLLSH